MPFASRRVAVIASVFPAWTLAGVGESVTVATGAGGGGAVTVTVALPLTPSLVAVIPTDPAATPVTRPVDETVAVVVLALVHVMVRPVSTTLFASYVVAASVVEPPTATLAVAGVTDTRATGAGGGATDVTVIVALPVTPSLRAVIVAVPAPTPLTAPLLDTVATPVFELDHVTVRLLSVEPPASRRVAVACAA